MDRSTLRTSMLSSCFHDTLNITVMLLFGLVNTSSRLIYGFYALVKLCRLYVTVRRFNRIPSLGKVSPVCYHATTERSFTVVVSAVTKRNSEHVVDLVRVQGIASPQRPRTTRTAMVKCVHVNLVLQQQHATDCSR